MNEATLPPEEASMWLRLGLRAVRAGDYAEARRYFQWAREAAPDNVVALLWSAGLAGNRDQAVALLTRVLELEPHNEHARAGMRALGQADDMRQWLTTKRRSTVRLLMRTRRRRLAVLSNGAGGFWQCCWLPWYWSLLAFWRSRSYVAA